MKCPKCQFENQEDARFCNKCGSKLEIGCPECGVTNLPGSSFCKGCGHKLVPSSEARPKDLSFDEKIAKIQRYLPEGLTEKILSQRDRIEGERKQVTVMFCDMEGFTALTERLGPEEAYAVMDDVYEILIHKVHDYGGTVNEMTGDGIMALFGAPIALEDAPQRAIRSSIAIHREMVEFSDRMRKEREALPSLKMRVGVHTGPVVVGTLGNDLRVEFKAVGDTVNLASRMEELAQPGTTYVTEDTFRLTEGLFRFEALGAKELKGKKEPVNVYQVIAPSTRRTRFDVSAERGLTPFVGRERELELLLDGFGRAKTGRGQAFSIVAEAGLGKSRLLYEFRKAVTNEDMTFLEGRSLSYSRGIAYHPVIDMLKSNFDIREEDRPFQITEKVKAGLAGLGAEEAATLPYLLELLSIEENGVERVPLSPETRKERIIDSLRRIVLRGSEIRPLVLAFEDLHWVDKSSEDVFKSLLESIPGAPVLLIFTYRPEFVHTWGGRSFHSQLTLSRLSNRESLAMVTHLLGTDSIERTLENLILDKTEGVPFFIEEFLESLKQLKIIERKEHTYYIAKDAREVAIPSTIQDVIMARVDSLPEGAKELLQTGSAIDREFSYELIKRVADLPEQELLSRLSGLRDSELLYERGVYPKSAYIFKHALTQEVAYNSLLVKRRKEIHEKIGKAIEELYAERLEEYYEILAHHYMRSDNKDKAVEYLDLANRKAARASAMDQAKAYFDQAMSILDTLPDTLENRERRISLLGNQAEVFGWLLQMRQYYDLLTRYEPLLEETENPGLRGAFYGSIGATEYAFANFDRAIQFASKGIELCRASGSTEALRLAYPFLIFSHSYRGDFERALAVKDEAVRQTEAHFDLGLYVYALCGASWTLAWMGRWDEAVEEAEKALDAAEGFSDNRLGSFAAWSISLAYSWKGDLEKAVRFAELSVEKAPTPADRTLSEGYLGWAWCRAGLLDKGVELLIPVVEACRAVGFAVFEYSSAAYLGEGYLLAEQYEKARETLRDFLQLATTSGAKWIVGWSYHLLGEVALKTDLEGAQPHFEQAISIFREIKAENFLALAYSGMGRLHKLRGEFAEARRYFTDALEIFERLGTLIEPDKVRKELADLPQ
jgi:class 3 adenylate cyclase/tetratricopeptide (TPR) repeat protein